MASYGQSIRQKGSRAALHAQLAQRNEAASPQKTSQVHHQRLRWWFSRKDKKGLALGPKIHSLISEQERQLEKVSRLKEEEEPLNDECGSSYSRRTFLVSNNAHLRIFQRAHSNVIAIGKEEWRGELGSEKHVRFWHSLKEVLAKLPDCDSLIKLASGSNSRLSGMWSDLCCLLRRLVMYQAIVDNALTIRKAGTCRHARPGCCRSGHFIDARPYGLDFADHYVNDAQECRALTEARLDQVRFKLDNYNHRLSELDGQAFNGIEVTLKCLKKTITCLLNANCSEVCTDKTRVISNSSHTTTVNSSAVDLEEEEDETDILIKHKRKVRRTLDSDDEDSSDGESDAEMQRLRKRLRQSHEDMDRELRKADKLVKEDQRRQQRSLANELRIPSPRALRIGSMDDDAGGVERCAKNYGENFDDDDDDDFWKRRPSASFATRSSDRGLSYLGMSSNLVESENNLNALSSPVMAPVAGPDFRVLMPPLAPAGFLWLNGGLSGRIKRKRKKSVEKKLSMKPKNIPLNDGSNRTSLETRLGSGSQVGKESGDARIDKSYDPKVSISNMGDLVSTHEAGMMFESLIKKEASTDFLHENVWFSYEKCLLDKMSSRA